MTDLLREAKEMEGPGSGITDIDAEKPEGPGPDGADYIMRKVTAPHPIRVRVPGSKSISNRALLIAALAEGTSTLHGVLFSDDSRYFLKALQGLGFPVEVEEAGEKVTITGFGGRIPKKHASVYVGSAGTAARFLTAFLGLSDGNYYLDSSEQMKKRPMKELLESLEFLGTEVSWGGEEWHFPYTVGNPTGIILPEVTVDVEKSSQFLSALLISSVLSDHDFRIHVSGSHGMAYVRMTIQMMRQFGVHVEQLSENEYLIPGNAAYKAMDYTIEPDLSAACYFYAMSPLLGVPSQVYGVHSDSMQGDLQFLDVLCSMGCGKEETGEGIRILPPLAGQGRSGEPPVGADGDGAVDEEESEAAIEAVKNTIKFGKLAGGSFDLSSFSDQALTLAAIAPFASSPVTITGIGHIRYQECDRIRAIVSNLQALGVSCRTEEENSFSIEIDPLIDKESLQAEEDKRNNGINGQKNENNENPGKNRRETESLIQTYEDHRVAMAFSLPGLVVDGIRIENYKCCRKTFERYFEVMEEAVYG